jgi:hypothetical protein
MPIPPQEGSSQTSTSTSTPTPTPSSLPVKNAVISNWGLSPFPAWAFSTALLASPAFRPPPILIESTTSTTAGIFKRSRILSSYPSNVQVLLFSSFVGLGGFMCFDNDPTNGAAVISVWSLLYTLSNAKRSLWNLKFYPKALISLSVANTVLYGAKYFNII